MICTVDWGLTFVLLLLTALFLLFRLGWIVLLLVGVILLFKRCWRMSAVLLICSTVWGVAVLARGNAASRRSRSFAASELWVVGEKWRRQPQEVLFMRQADWRSEKALSRAMRQYRVDNPHVIVGDEVLMDALRHADIQLCGSNSTIRIEVQVDDVRLSVALADAYAKALVEFSAEENRRRCDYWASQTHRLVEIQRRRVAEFADKADPLSRAEYTIQTNVLSNLMAEEENVRQEVNRNYNETLSIRRLASEDAQKDK